MYQQNIKQRSGFSRILLILAVLLVIGVVSILVYIGQANPKKPKNSKPKGTTSKLSSSTKNESSVSTIKNLPINIDKYNPSTGMAGGVEFTKWDMKSGGIDAIFSEYGRKISVNNSIKASRLNPQPTFVAPLGAKVYSIVDGTIYDVPKLYSNDYSIMVQGLDKYTIFEIEHVINPLVKKGERVKAGQVIAEVSDYDSHNLNGLGLVEIGVLLPGDPPKYACTFNYLNFSAKDVILAQITQLMSDWEIYMGDQSIYNQFAQITPGCATQDNIEG